MKWKCSGCKQEQNHGTMYSSPTGMICEACQIARITETEQEKKSVDKLIAKKKLKK